MTGPIFAWALAAVVVVFVGGALGVFGYVVISFARMLRYTEPRPWRTTLREALRETWWVLLTQPFLGLFYLVGRRMGGGPTGTPVVFVHGFGHNRVAFWWLARRLARRGLGPLFAMNYVWLRDLAAIAQEMGVFLRSVRAETGAAHVDVVCHSMGGLVALEYLRSTGAEAHVRRCVTIATPHAGVSWHAGLLGRTARQLRSEGEFLRTLAAAALGVPVLSIYSTHDNIVHPPATSALTARGGRDEVIAGGGHVSLLFQATVAEHVARFLLAPDPASQAVAVTPAAAVATHSRALEPLDDDSNR